MLRKKEIWVPTPKGWLIIIALVVAFVLIYLNGVYSFLALNAPVEAKTLVVADWLPDEAQKEVLDIINDNNYDLLLVAGGQKLYGWNATKFSSSSELLRVKLIERGFDSTKVIAISDIEVERDRTFNAALSTKKWIDHSGDEIDNINVVSIGAHSRRSLLLYQEAFDSSNINIGIIALSEHQYDKNKWWRTSEGTKTILGETVAYIHTKLFF